MNNYINQKALSEVAKGLKELRSKVVFVGGAVINLYNDDSASEEIRPTEDIDFTVNLNSYIQWVQMQERLMELHFYPDPQGHSICSYKFNGIAIDIMPAEDTVIGVSNRWYKSGFDSLTTIKLENNLDIKILTAPYFLATKFEAFKNRGNLDYRGSHDFEDIIFVLDNRTSIVKEILLADEIVRTYLKQELQILLDHKNSNEILSMHIHPLIVEERYSMLIEKINLILQ